MMNKLTHILLDYIYITFLFVSLCLRLMLMYVSSDANGPTMVIYGTYSSNYK